jgi:hypothetical protein
MITTPSLLEAALDYVTQGFKVFPVGLDKKPLTKHGFKDATQIQARVQELWGQRPNAGIATPTDGLTVLDFDAKHGGLDSKEDIDLKFGKLPTTRTHRTGGGGLHYIYRNPNGSNIRNTVEFGGYKGVDLRANGGYIVLPPSLHESGNRYEVVDDSEIAMAPDWLLKIALSRKLSPTIGIKTGQPIPHGQRNASLASLAGTMRRREMSQIAIEAALLEVNRTQCQPPLTDNEVRAIAESIAKYPVADGNNISSINYSPTNTRSSSERDKSVTVSVTKPLSEQIEEWIKDTRGAWFSYDDIDREFGIQTATEKDNRRQIMKRFRDAGTIESHPKKVKLFRYVNVTVRLVDFKSAGKRTPLAIRYPFGLENYFNTYPGNIIALAGASDAGKTGWLLNFIKMNQYGHSIFYQTSEMGREELASRLEKFDGINLDEWNFTAEERSRDFADVIRPDCINITDYMELAGDFYAVADYLRQIHDRLACGICLVALQKKRGAELGRGGDFGLEKPRLYLSMDKGVLTIQKCKNWVNPMLNPNGLKFIVTRDWYDPDNPERDVTPKKKFDYDEPDF